MTSGYKHTQSSRFSTAVAVLALWAISTNGLEYSGPGITITPERLLALPLLGIALFALAARKRAVISNRSTLLLVSWLATSLISSILSPVSAWALKMWVVLTIAAAYFFIPILLETDVYRVVNSKAFTLAAFLVGPFAAFVYLLQGTTDLPPELLRMMIQNDYNGGVRLKAFSSEANIFGALLLIFLFGMLARKDKWTISWWMLYFWLNLSMVFSFSRIPWAAYGIGLLMYWLMVASRAYDLSRTIKSTLAIIASTGLVIVALIIVVDLYGDSENLNRTNSIVTRFIMWTLALEDVYLRPFIGSGVFSFSEMHPNAPAMVGSESYRAAWISNLFLAVVHDTGIIGFAFFFALLSKIILRGWRKARIFARSGYPAAASLAAACTAAAFSILVSGQSIPSHSLGLFWFSFALIESLPTLQKLTIGERRIEHDAGELL